jgi:hypothetical protein
MRTTHIAKYGWFTGSPADILRSVDIGVRLVTASTAPKLGLSGAVLLLAVSTTATCAAGIAGIDSRHNNTGPLGFIFQKQPQLRECPRMQNCPLLAPGLDPFADALQIFDGNPTSGAFSFGNDLLTDIVVHPCGEPSLLSRENPQTASGGAGLFLLKIPAQSPMAVPNGFDVRSGMALAIGIASDVRHTQVHAQKVGWLNSGTGGEIYGAVQVEFSLAIHQIGLPFDSVESLLLILAVHQRDDNPAFRQRPQAYAVESLEAEDTLVVRDCPMRLEYRTEFFIATEAFHGFTDGADGHLRGQCEAGPDFRIRPFMYRRLAENTGFESTPSCECRSLVHALHSFQQPLALFCVREQLQLEGELHVVGVYHSATNAAPAANRGGNLFLCHLKEAVSEV